MRMTMSEPPATLPEAPILIWSRSPVPTSALCISIRPWVSGMPMWSSKSMGAAPVPPSEPSTTMKSGAVPTARMALQMASTSRRLLTHILKPAGLPPESSRILAMNSMSSTGVLNTRCAAGLMQSTPMGTPRISETSLVILSAGSTPPMPGLAPWLSFSSTILTWSSWALSRNLAGSKSPSSVRAPK